MHVVDTSSPGVPIRWPIEFRGVHWNWRNYVVITGDSIIIMISHLSMVSDGPISLSHAREDSLLRALVAFLGNHTVVRSLSVYETSRFISEVVSS